MSPAEVTVSDVLSQMDSAVTMVRKVGHLGPRSPEFVEGYLSALIDFRRFIRSQDFPIIVRATKETSKNAHRP